MYFRNSILSISLLILSTLSFQNCGKYESTTYDSFGSSSYTPTNKNNPYTCKGELLPQADPLKRLSKKEYLNTISDLLPGAFNDADFNKIATIIPVDLNHDFSSVELPKLKEIEAYLKSSDEILKIILKSNQKIIQALGFNCQNISDSSCINQWVKDFGFKAYRRPLDSQEQGAYTASFQEESDLNEGLRAVTMEMLNSPHFLYKVEVNGLSVDSKVLRLSPYELASRVSYLLTQSMPDKQLFEAAKTGALDRKSGLEVQIDRLLKTQRFKEVIHSFSEKWLHYKNSNLSFYSNYILDGIKITPEVQAAIKKEAENFLDHIIDTDGSYEDLMTSRYADIPHSEVAKLYGVASTGVMELPEDERSGILSRIAALAKGQDSTSIIHRGLTIYEDILCTPLPTPELTPPPLPPVDRSRTQREVITQATQSTSCTGCHSRINPMGFAFEKFDSLGRFRAFEKRYDSSSGAVTAELPINAETHLIFRREIAKVNGPVSMINTVTKQAEAPACFVKQWSRWAHARETTRNDDCTLAPMFDSLTGSQGSIKNMVKQLILSEHFAFRAIAQEGE